MFNDGEYDTLLAKRKVELECLGIDPRVYVLISKKLNKDYIFIYKGVATYIFDKQDNPIRPEDIKEVLRLVFGLDEILAENVYTEWRRDRVIYHNMMEEPSKYYNWLTLPLPK